MTGKFVTSFFYFLYLQWSTCLFTKSMLIIILMSYWQWNLCYIYYLRNLIFLAVVHIWIPLILKRTLFLWSKPCIDVFHNSWLKVIHILPFLFNDFIYWAFWKKMIDMLSSFLCTLTFGYLKTLGIVKITFDYSWGSWMCHRIHELLNALAYTYLI